MLVQDVQGGLRWLAPLPLLCLAAFFGRTLRAGHTPLIERIARRSTPGLSLPLCRYTRRLTLVWCGYFLAAAALSAVDAWAGAIGAGRVGLGVLAGSALLFAGERWARPWLFPQEVFPGLSQQLSDTWSVFRITNGSGTKDRP
jgi:uncharacterized membrane protein